MTQTELENSLRECGFSFYKRADQDLPIYTLPFPVPSGGTEHVMLHLDGVWLKFRINNWLNAGAEPSQELLTALLDISWRLRCVKTAVDKRDGEVILDIDYPIDHDTVSADVLRNLFGMIVHAATVERPALLAILNGEEGKDEEASESEEDPMMALIRGGLTPSTRAVDDALRSLFDEDPGIPSDEQLAQISAFLEAFDLDPHAMEDSRVLFREYQDFALARNEPAMNRRTWLRLLKIAGVVAQRHNAFLGLMKKIRTPGNDDSAPSV